MVEEIFMKKILWCSRTSKTLIIANQSEIPVRPFMTLTCNGAISNTSMILIIPFFLPDKRFNVLGIPGRELSIFTLQEFTTPIKLPLEVYPSTASFGTLFGNCCPLLPVFINFFLKIPPFYKLNTVRTPHFRLIGIKPDVHKRYSSHSFSRCSLNLFSL